MRDKHNVNSVHTDDVFGKSDRAVLPQMVATYGDGWLYTQAGECSEQNINRMAEAENIFWGANKMFSVQVINKLSCYTSKLLH